MTKQELTQNLKTVIRKQIAEAKTDYPPESYDNSGEDRTLARLEECGDDELGKVMNISADYGDGLTTVYRIIEAAGVTDLTETDEVEITGADWDMFA